MARINFRAASQALPHRHLENPPLPALIRRAEVEDAIARACAAENNPLALACEIAALAVRWWDDELTDVPECAGIYVVEKRDREQLECLLNQVHRSLQDQIQAALVFADLSPRVTADEFFLAAWNALSYFRQQARIRP